MKGTAPFIRDIARAYGVCRQHAHDLCKRHGLTVEDLRDPEKVFDKLLERGRGCPLRTRLANPVTRAIIREEIELAAIRGPVPDIEGKIQSIK